MLVDQPHRLGDVGHRRRPAARAVVQLRAQRERVDQADRRAGAPRLLDVLVDARAHLVVVLDEHQPVRRAEHDLGRLLGARVDDRRGEHVHVLLGHGAERRAGHRDDDVGQLGHARVAVADDLARRARRTRTSRRCRRCTCTPASATSSVSAARGGSDSSRRAASSLRIFMPVSRSPIRSVSRPRRRRASFSRDDDSAACSAASSRVSAWSMLPAWSGARGAVEQQLGGRRLERGQLGGPGVGDRGLGQAAAAARVVGGVGQGGGDLRSCPVAAWALCQARWRTSADTSPSAACAARRSARVWPW